VAVPDRIESVASAFSRWLETDLTDVPDLGEVGPDPDRTIYQTSTMAALLDGVYDGDVTIAELLRHGDFGLGTFNRLDGEMLILDGVCFQLRADGTATVADPEAQTPFAAVTWFHPDHTINIDAPHDRADLTALIDESLESENLLYAIRITGQFSTIRTRTVTEQHQPYPRLTEATGSQQTRTLTNATGTLAGYRTPDYEQGISVAGYHLHYIDCTRHHGGHALDYTFDHGTIEISTRSEFHLSLQRTPQFLHAELNSADLDNQIRHSEGG
jgi:acetolactate decarboxylase